MGGGRDGVTYLKGRGEITVLACCMPDTCVYCTRIIAILTDLSTLSSTLVDTDLFHYVVRLVLSIYMSLYDPGLCTR